MRPDIRVRRAKNNVKTDAQRVFAKMEILNERPEGMNINEYRAARKLQGRAMKVLFPGPVDQRIAGAMRPKQKSEHQLLMIKNAMFMKYGHNITEEAEENKVDLLLSETGWFNKVMNKVRGVFGNSTETKL